VLRRDRASVGEFDIFDLAEAGYLGGRVLWNETKPRLGASERRFPVKIALRAILVRPDLSNLDVTDLLRKINESIALVGIGRLLSR
jgi:hypothetical protein